MLKNTEFELAFQAANGAYALDAGGGFLRNKGYEFVDKGIWVVEETGLEAALYNDSEGNYILAFAGSEGAQDWYQNLSSMGYGQWFAVREQVYTVFNQIIKNEDLEGGINSLTITGHSLGGALAQYAAYDLHGKGYFSSDKLKLVTFNGLGGVEGLKKEYSNEFDPSRLNGATIHNYFNPSDLVVQLSEHLGGQSANYQLIANTGAEFFLDAHSIETIDEDFLSGQVQINTQANHNYYDLKDILPFVQKLSSGTNGLLGGGQHEANEMEATARLIAVLPGIAAMEAFSLQPEEYLRLRDWVLDNFLETKMEITDPDDRKKAVLGLSIAISYVSTIATASGFASFIEATSQIYASYLEHLFATFPEADVSAPVKDTLFFSMFSALSGASLNEQGLVEGGSISRVEVDYILDEAAEHEFYRYSNVASHLSKILDISIDDDFMGYIELHHQIIDQGIQFGAVADGHGLSENQLKSWIAYEGYNDLSGRLARYSVMNNVPFILLGPEDESRVLLEIRESKIYAKDTYSEQYWDDRVTFYQLSLSQNAINLPYGDIFKGEYELYQDLETGAQAKTYLFADKVDAFKFGSDQADTGDIDGGDYNDHLYGREGDDTINGNGGRDYIEGNANNDTLHGGSDTDYLYGGTGNDHLHGDEGNDYLFGGEGADTYYYVNGDGNDSIHDNDGLDKLVINGNTVSQITQTSNDSTIYQDDYDNTYVLDASGEMLITVINGNQAGTINIDWFHKDTNNFGITVNEPNATVLPVTTYVVGTDNLGSTYGDRIQAGQSSINNQGIEFHAETATGVGVYNGEGEFTFEGGNLGDNLTGGIYADKLNGLAGDDYISGLGGTDFLDGGLGSDTILGGESIDFLSGNNMNKSPYGDSSLYVKESEISSDFISGGEGNDVISGDEGNDTLFGGAGNDSIAGGDGADIISGGSENDNIFGDSDRALASTSFDSLNTQIVYADSVDGVHSYDDVIDGGAGNDHIVGEIGNDTIQGGSGDDWIMGDRQAKAEDLLIDGAPDPDFVVLDSSLHGDDNLFGGAGNDTIAGNSGDDYLDGGTENDFLWGDDQDIDGADHGKDTLVGGAGNDQLIGGGEADLLYGGDGQDLLIGDEDVFDGETTISLDGAYHGKDELHGGNDNDTLIGGGNADQLFGDSGNDVIFGDSLFESGTSANHGGWEVPYSLGNDTYALDKTHHGDDNIDGGAGDDALFGGSGKDTILGGSGVDLIFGQEGDDTLYGGVGQDNLFGGSGDDTLVGDGGDDYLIGGSGTNTYVINIGSGRDTVELSDGEIANIQVADGYNDYDFFVLRQGNNFSLEHNTDEQNIFIEGFYSGASGDTALNSISFSNGVIWNKSDIASKSIEGSEYSQTMFAFDSGSTLSGLGGDDTLTGGAGDDTLIGGAGNDLLYGGSGLNTYQFSINDGQDILTIDGTATSEKLVLLNGIVKTDIYISRLWDDFYLKFKGSSDQIYIKDFFKNNDPKQALTSIQFSDGEQWDYQQILAVQGLTGTDRGDTTGGTEGDDYINGLGGRDHVYGYGGNDTIDGGLGNDSLDGGDGDDTLLGGIGADNMWGGWGHDYLSGGTHDDRLNGNQGNDKLYGGEGNDYLLGQEGNDELYGGEGNDDLTGQSGDDYLEGGAGDDYLYGGLGDDQLYGGDGDDELESRHGNDILYGESGSDTLKASSYLSSEVELYGGSDDDYLYGGMGHNLLSGGSGDDYLYGGMGRNSLSGGSGNDHIYAMQSTGSYQFSNQDSFIDGGTGDDIIAGGRGNDFYHFKVGDGQDTLTLDSGFDNVDIDTLIFDDHFYINNLWFSRTGDDLDIILLGTNDHILVTDWFVSSRSQLDNIHSGLNVITNEGINNLVVEMSSFAQPINGQITLNTDEQLIIDAAFVSNIIDDTVITAEDKVITIDVFENSNASGTEQGVSVALAQNGNVIVSELGVLEYTPNPNFNGTDIISYEVSDGNGDTVSSSVTVVVISIIDDLVTVDDFFTTEKDTQLVIRPQDNDLDIDGTTSNYDYYQLITPTVNGTAYKNYSDGSIWYSPDPSFSGVDFFTYSNTDSNGVSVEGITYITVNEGNAKPQVNSDQAQRTSVDTAINIDVLLNDSDPEGENLTVIEATSDHGIISFNLNGTLNYVPETGFSGYDTVFYTVIDESGNTGEAYVSVEVIDGNVAPISVNDTAITIESTLISNIDVLSNDTDVNNDELSVATVYAQYGDTSINPDNTINFLPDAGFIGTALISYQVNDGNGGVDNGGVYVRVKALNGVNESPVGVSDERAFTVEDMLVNINVLDNDSDPDGDYLTVSYARANNGAVTINLDGTLDYIPIESFVGLDTINYEISDGNGGSSGAIVQVWVSPVISDNKAPLGAVFIIGTMIENEILTASNTLSDEDGIGDISYQWQRDGIDINGATELTYVLGVSDVNTEIAVVASYIDGLGTLERVASELSSVVQSVNNTPMAFTDTAMVLEDTSVTIDVLANDTDPDGDSLTIDSASAINGSVIINPDGTLNYTPNTNFNGSDTINYEVSDGNGGMAVSTVAVTVSPENDVPELSTALTDQTTTEGELTSFVISSDSFTDIDAGDVLTYSASRADGSSLPDWLSFDSSTLAFSGTPSSIDIGELSIKVLATDSSGAAAEDIFNISVLIAEDQPLSIIGTRSAEVFHGGSADDYINAKGGKDQLFGYEGKDTLIGGGGSDHLYGGDGVDRLKGGGGNDHLYGETGNDVLIGGRGSDKYYFAAGDGFDRINNASTKFATETDSLNLLGANEDNVWFKKTNNHLDIYLLGSSDRVRVNNWYKEEKFELDRIDSAGSSIDSTGIEQLVSAMASFGAPSGGTIDLTPEDQHQVQSAIAAAWA